MWFSEAILKRLYGEGYMARYADDIVFCFQYETDARRFHKALKKRLEKFGLELSEDKSNIIKHGRESGNEAGKFDFLGFTFTIAKSRKGRYMVIKITSQKKLKVKKQKVKKWIKDNMHTPVRELIKRLNRKLRGHYNYYGLSHNLNRMWDFFYYVKRQLKLRLSRRSQKGKISWDKLEKILKFNPLLRPTITRPLWSAPV